MPHVSHKGPTHCLHTGTEAVSQHRRLLRQTHTHRGCWRVCCSGLHKPYPPRKSTLVHAQPPPDSWAPHTEPSPSITPAITSSPAGPSQTGLCLLSLAFWASSMHPEAQRPGLHLGTSDIFTVQRSNWRPRSRGRSRFGGPSLRIKSNNYKSKCTGSLRRDCSTMMRPPPPRLEGR